VSRIDDYLEDTMKKTKSVKVIDDNMGAYLELSSRFGSDVVELSTEDIRSMTEDGKLLLFDVNGEYTVLLRFKETKRGSLW